MNDLYVSKPGPNLIPNPYSDFIFTDPPQFETKNNP